jgi:hypothetical protein
MAVTSMGNDLRRAIGALFVVGAVAFEGGGDGAVLNVLTGPTAGVDDGQDPRPLPALPDDCAAAARAADPPWPTSCPGWPTPSLLPGPDVLAVTAFPEELGWRR